MKRTTYDVVSLGLMLGLALLLGGCEMLGLADNPTTGNPAGPPNGTTSIAMIALGAGASSTTLSAAGSTLALTATAKNGTGAALATQPTFIWASSSPAIATVDANGVVTAVANGTTSITASAGGTTGNLLVTVSIPAATSIPSAPAKVLAAAGNASVTLTWDPVVGATSYTVYVSILNPPTKTMAIYLGTSFSNATSPYKAVSAAFITNGSAAYYAVSATNALGESALSATVACTPSAVAIAPSANDGLVWSAVATGSSQTLSKIAYSGSMYVAAAGADGSGSLVLTSPDRAIWTQRTADGRLNNTNALAWSGSAFLSIGGWGGSEGFPSLSADGVTWSQKAASPTHLPPYTNGLAWSPSLALFVAVGSGISTSPDGIVWTARSSTGGFNNVIWAGNQFVAVGNSSSIYTSPDGVTWTARPATNTTKNLFGVAWSGSLLVVVGGMGAIWTSPDGITWTDHTVGDPTNHQFSAVAWNGTRFAAAEKLGLSPSVAVIDTSSDGVTWAPSYVSPVSSATLTHAIKDLIWDGSRFVAVGAQGMVYLGQ